jgi:hypothetical protein
VGYVESKGVRRFILALRKGYHSVRKETDGEMTGTPRAALVLQVKLQFLFSVFQKTDGPDHRLFSWTDLFRSIVGFSQRRTAMCTGIVGKNSRCIRYLQGRHLLI